MGFKPGVSGTVTRCPTTWVTINPRMLLELNLDIFVSGKKSRKPFLGEKPDESRGRRRPGKVFLHL